MGYLGWLILAVVFGIVETLTLGFWFLGLALAALAVGLVAALRLVTGLSGQIAIFAALTVLFIVFARPLAKRLFRSQEVKSNVDSLVGLIGVVTQEIAPLQPGLVKIYGEIWTASSDQSIAADSRVVIRAVEGVRLLVDPLEELKKD